MEESCKQRYIRRTYGLTMQIRLRFVRQKYTEICLTRSMLAQSQLSKSELFDIANQPTNGSPLKKKEENTKKRASKLPRANGNRLNGQKSLGDPGIWHLHLANENLTRFAGKLLLQYARSRLSPWTAFFKVTRAIHPLQLVVSVPPSPFCTPFSSPYTRNPLVQPLLTSATFSLEQQTRGIFDLDYGVANPAGHLCCQSTEAFPRNWFLRNAKQPGIARERGFVFRQGEPTIFRSKPRSEIN